MISINFCDFSTVKLKVEDSPEGRQFIKTWGRLLRIANERKAAEEEEKRRATT